MSKDDDINWSDWDDMYNEYIGKPKNDDPPEFNKCICENIMGGCKCGAFLQEQILKEEIIKKAERDNQADLAKGVPYEERVRRYGHIIKTV